MGKTRRITQVAYVMTLADGNDYKIRPLSLVEVKEITSKLKGLDKIAPDTDLEAVPGLMDKLIEVCSVILMKSNPNLTTEIVGKIVNRSEERREGKE